MIRFSMVLLAGVGVCAICASPPAVGSPAPGIVAPLPPDRIPAVLSLPRDYEEDWLLAFDTGYHGFDGEIILLDPTPEKRDFLGSVRGGGSYSAAFALSRARGELYVAESIYDRITSGTRTDYLTVYDTAQLSPQAEIVLPGAKRAMVAPHKGLLRLTGDERFALLFNFTPASSVTVVDVVKRAVVNEVPIPGCALVYPAGPRGFATLCANGALASYVLDESGQVLSEQLSRPFNDIEGDVLFMDPAMIGGVAYFPSYRGRVQPIDLQASPAPAVLADWPLTTAQDVRHSWRPTGMQPAAADGKGRLFVLMRRNARDGSSGEPGSQVWIYDVQRKLRIGRIQLKTDGVGIEATRSARGLLAVTTEGHRIDIYEVQSGQRLRSIGDWEVKPGLLEAMAPVAGSAPMSVDPLLMAVLQVGLAGLLLSSAVHKLRAWPAFVASVRSYRLAPEGSSQPLAGLLALAEVALGSAVLFAPTRPGAAGGAAALFGVYLLAMAVNLARGRRMLDCGCSWAGRSGGLSSWHLLRNAVLMAWAAGASLPVTPAVREWGGLEVVTVGAAVMTLGLLYLAMDALLAHRLGSVGRVE